MQNAASGSRKTTGTPWVPSWEAYILLWRILPFAVAANWQHMETVSLNSEIAYLGSARGDRLTAEAVCVKDGRTTSYYRIEVKDSEERLIAVVNTTGYKTAR